MDQQEYITSLHATHSNDNPIRLVHGGREYFELLEELADGAKYLVHLQVYIFEDDETGLKVADALMRAASRGVKVYLLVDGYASQDMSAALVHIPDRGVVEEFIRPKFQALTSANYKKQFWGGSWRRYCNRRAAKQFYGVDDGDSTKR